MTSASDPGGSEGLHVEVDPSTGFLAVPVTELGRSGPLGTSGLWLPRGARLTFDRRSGQLLAVVIEQPERFGESAFPLAVVGDRARLDPVASGHLWRAALTLDLAFDGSLPPVVDDIACLEYLTHLLLASAPEDAPEIRDVFTDCVEAADRAVLDRPSGWTGRWLEPAQIQRLAAWRSWLRSDVETFVDEMTIAAPGLLGPVRGRRHGAVDTPLVPLATAGSSEGIRGRRTRSVPTFRSEPPSRLLHGDGVVFRLIEGTSRRRLRVESIDDQGEPSLLVLLSTGRGGARAVAYLAEAEAGDEVELYGDAAATDLDLVVSDDRRVLSRDNVEWLDGLRRAASRAWLPRVPAPNGSSAIWDAAIGFVRAGRPDLALGAFELGQERGGSDEWPSAAQAIRGAPATGTAFARPDLAWADLAAEVWSLERG